MKGMQVRLPPMSIMDIADDGIGMPDVVRAGVGLAGMRSRLSELGGRLSFRSRFPGTAVVASIQRALDEKPSRVYGAGSPALRG